MCEEVVKLLTAWFIQLYSFVSILLKKENSVAGPPPLPGPHGVDWHVPFCLGIIITGLCIVLCCFVVWDCCQCLLFSYQCITMLLL